MCLLIYPSIHLFIYNSAYSSPCSFTPSSPAHFTGKYAYIFIYIYICMQSVRRHSIDR